MRGDLCVGKEELSEPLYCISIKCRMPQWGWVIFNDMRSTRNTSAIDRSNAIDVLGTLCIRHRFMPTMHLLCGDWYQGIADWFSDRAQCGEALCCASGWDKLCQSLTRVHCWSTTLFWRLLLFFLAVTFIRQLHSIISLQINESLVTQCGNNWQLPLLIAAAT